MRENRLFTTVIPAEAGIQYVIQYVTMQFKLGLRAGYGLDSGFRQNDGGGV